ITGADAITIKAYDNFNETLGVTANDKEDGDLTSKINIEGNVDTIKEGVYTLVYSVTDSDGNISSVRRRVKVRSNNKPEIIGASEVTLKVGNTFDSLQGILARDFEDGNITKNISVTGAVDISKIGEYKIQYSITDSDGNTTTAERKIIVESNEKPIISGTENKVIKIGDEFNPLEGIIASDFEDKDLTNKILVTGSVNNNAIGDYKLTYSVTDSDGNITNAERVITVRTNTKPKILAVEDTIIKVGDNFENTSLAVLSMDEEDGDITNLVSIKGKVDSNTEGEYKLVYSVTDSDGNTTTAERKVTVRSNEKPVITGADAITIKAYDNFNETLGVTANDKEDGDLTSKINIEGNVDTIKEGVYTLVYSVTDSDGNISSVRRSVKVRSNTKPEIIGTSEVKLKVGNKFDPLQGILARDFEDGDITKNILVTGNVDTSKIGEYKIQYSITDSDGNIITTERKIIVESNEKPLINGAENKVIKIGDEFNPLEGIAASDFEDKDLTNKISVTGSVNNNAVGDYKLTYSVRDSDGNTTTAERVITVRTNTKPKILALEDTTIKVGDNFENSYLANDKEDGNITNLVSIKGKVDSNIEGEYTLIYSVTDSDGNTTTAERKVTVRSNEKPYFLNIKNTVIKQGDYFNPYDGGIIALDKENGDLTEKIIVKGILDTSKVGTYDLIYSVTDNDGNDTRITRRINVRAINNIEILGVNNIEIPYGEPFDVMKGIKAIDSQNNDLTSSIIIEGNVDVNKLGSYTLIYSIKNEQGKELKFFREIIVKNKEKLKKLSPEFQPIIKDFLVPKIQSEKFNINRKKSSIAEENSEKIIENILLPEPQSNILKEELKESKNEEFIKNYKGKTLPPEDTNPLPLWLFGIISIAVGRKIRKKDE
ncbi:immunoglobulin-like domain-containing protein, partial [Clostridium tarantellae]